ncbi:MAG: PIN domain-containing protein [Proteobacteria bacterium]|nr:PIN domain-containing protein [Pseudomonadota bacterium]
MKLFLDTNVILEYLEARSEYLYVKRIFDAIEDGSHEAYISTGSVYTLTYLILSALKRNQIYRPEQIIESRKILNNITHLVHVIDLKHESIVFAINDNQFTDLEDSYQYRCALEHACEFLITINTKDYKNTNNNVIRILSPRQFVESVL